MRSPQKRRRSYDKLPKEKKDAFYELVLYPDESLGKPE